MKASKLSKRCKYAIMAVVELGKSAPGDLLTISQIAKNQGIPARFLEAILRDLKSAGIVDSVRGNSGGYFLKAKAEEVNIGIIVETLESGLNLSNVSSLSDCEKIIEEAYSKACESFFSTLSSVTLADIMEKIQSRETVINYVI